MSGRKVLRKGARSLFTRGSEKKGCFVLDVRSVRVRAREKWEYARRGIRTRRILSVTTARRRYLFAAAVTTATIVARPKFASEKREQYPLLSRFGAWRRSRNPSLLRRHSPLLVLRLPRSDKSDHHKQIQLLSRFRAERTFETRSVDCMYETTYVRV